MDYGIESYEAIVGNNPEMADMGNPRGDIFGLVYYATITTPEGKIFSTNRSFTDKDEALADAAFYEEHQIDPEVDEGWTFLRYRYGSEAHFFNLHEAELALMDDEELAHRYFNAA